MIVSGCNSILYTMRYLRLLLAAASLSIVTLLFLSLSPAMTKQLHWIVEIQFLPAFLAVNVCVMLVLLVLTLLFGRLYCSVICPLGIAQDAVTGIASAFKSKKAKKKPFAYAPANNILRYGVLVLFIAALASGIGAVFAALDPYGAYGRIVSNFLTPVAIAINNILADGSVKANNFDYIHRPEMIVVYPSLIMAGATVLIVGALAWFKGRYYCNSICPVGTMLGLLSRFSLFRPLIDMDKCVSCKQCSFKCRAACIDANNHAIDTSRCVMCLDCTKVCSKKAIVWKWVNPFSCACKSSCEKPVATKVKLSPKTDANAARAADKSRRDFFMFAGAVVAANTLKGKKPREKKGDGGLAKIDEKRPSARSESIVPPGARSQSNFYRRCTGCQLCIVNCPNKVLRPSDEMDTLLQPEMCYERGFCRPECTECSQMCPTGAIQPISVPDKSNTKIGRAVCNHAACISVKDGVSCGHCARRCPTGAIKMVPSVMGDANSPMKPLVNDALCIGCGACEFYCPVRPQAAIFVEGLIDHRPLS